MGIRKMLINLLLPSRGRVDGVFVRPRRRDAVTVDATLYAVRLLDGVAAPDDLYAIEQAPRRRHRRIVTSSD
jgi:hypothetical protein